MVSDGETEIEFVDELPGDHMYVPPDGVAAAVNVAISPLQISAELTLTSGVGFITAVVFDDDVHEEFAVFTETV